MRCRISWCAFHHYDHRLLRREFFRAEMVPALLASHAFDRCINPLASQAEQARFETLVVTLDTMNLGWRPQDLRSCYLPFAHATGFAVDLSDPVFMSKLGMEPWPNGKFVEFPYVPEDVERWSSEGDEDRRSGRWWVCVGWERPTRGSIGRGRI